jgi:hypothetical protein
MIGCTYKDRLWAWDFHTKETLCWTEKIMVELKGTTMMVAKRSPVPQARIVNYIQT